MFQTTRIESKPMILEGASKLRITLTMCKLTLRHPALMTWQGLSLPFVKSSYVFNLSATAASLNNVRTRHTWST